MPRFYLEGFADQGHLGVAMLPGDKRFSQSTRTAATINDFYLLGSAVHPRAGDFEAMLSDFESEASAVFRTLANGTWPLCAQDRAVLGVFIAVQFLRGPEHRQQMAEIRRQMIRLQFQFAGRDRFVKTVAERLQADLSDDEFEELWQLTVRPGGPPVAVRPDQHANELVNLLPKLLKYFLGRPWALVSFERKHLITSDAPVALVPRRDAQDEEGVGLMTAAAILFPLSRSQGLVMADPMPIWRAVTVEQVSAGVADLRLPASAAHARSFNSAAVINARRAVFHHPADAALAPDRLPEPVSEEAAAPA